MTAAELAARITGRAYRDEITQDEAAEAKAAGLVVVFGASDDLIEFAGAIYDEAGVYDGGHVRIDRAGIMPSWESIRNDIDEDDAKAHFARLAAGVVEIEAVWGPEDPEASWLIKAPASLPHATFDVMEDGELFCRGIVFSINDIPAAAEAK